MSSHSGKRLLELKIAFLLRKLHSFFTTTPSFVSFSTGFYVKPSSSSSSMMIVFMVLSVVLTDVCLTCAGMTSEVFCLAASTEITFLFFPFPLTIRIAIMTTINNATAAIATTVMITCYLPSSFSCFASWV